MYINIYVTRGQGVHGVCSALIVFSVTHAVRSMMAIDHWQPRTRTMPSFRQQHSIPEKVAFTRGVRTPLIE